MDALIANLLRTLKPQEVDGMNPLDVIFSCCVCNATFSEAYEDHNETVQGFSDGIHPKTRRVTRVFLASCCHVFCSKHLEGGGPPFHPAGTRPRAPCPVCTKEGDLFSVRGFMPTEYDPMIPTCWFVTPPVTLDGKGSQMEALRFQYMSLIGYSKRTMTELRRVKAELAEVQYNLGQVQSLASEEHAKAVTLEQEVERLRPMESALRSFQERKPEIEHYLRTIPKLADQNEQMRRRLASLGFQMHFEPLNLDKQPRMTIDANDHMDINASRDGTGLVPVTSAHTMASSSNTLVEPEMQAAHSTQDRPLKRQRVDSPRGGLNIHAPPQKRTTASRDMMPPPSSSKPLSRMKSLKKMWPTFRKKNSDGHSSPAIGFTHSDVAEMVDGDGGNWGNAEQPAMPNNEYAPHREGTPYMTGALPAGRSPCLTFSPQPSMSHNASATGKAAEPEFRSPIQPSATRSNALPSEPSYIHIMDGLSHDSEFQLGLKDPRRNTFNQADTNTQNERFQFISTRDVGQHSGEKGSGHLVMDNAFLQSSPNGHSPAYRHANPLRSNPPRDIQDGALPETVFHPMTPAPQQTKMPVQPTESVVSPFFKSSNEHFQRYSRAGLAERGNSSMHSEAYQFRRPPIPNTQLGWREGRSLNGLSFFNSPVNERHEPVNYDNEYVQPNSFTSSERRYIAKNVDVYGFITRPEAGRSPFLSDSTYGSFDQFAPFRNIQSPKLSARHLRSSNRSSHGRATPLPSAMPSSVSSQQPRPQAQSSRIDWDTLAHVGVRNSQHQQVQHRSNSFATPARNIFMGTGRRSVRR